MLFYILLLKDVRLSSYGNMGTENIISPGFRNFWLGLSTSQCMQLFIHKFFVIHPFIHKFFFIYLLIYCSRMNIGVRPFYFPVLAPFRSSVLLYSSIHNSSIIPFSSIHFLETRECIQYLRLSTYPCMQLFIHSSITSSFFIH